MTRRRFLPFVLLAGVAVFFALPLGADKKKPTVTATKLLKKGAILLQRGRVEPAAEALRALLRQFPDTPEATRGRKLLRASGIGLECRVLLKERRNLKKLGYTEAKSLTRAEKILNALKVFYGQTYGKSFPLEIRFVIYDSRGRFRAEFPRAGRLGDLKIIPPDPEGKTWKGTVSVYRDSRIANPQDASDLLFEALAAETALFLLRSHAKRPLPAALESGLADYLGARLFRRKLVTFGQTPEGILKGFAREGLVRIQKLQNFKMYLLSPSPEGEVSSRNLWQWRGLSYAIVDYLVNGPISGVSNGKAKSSKGARKTPGKRGAPPRNSTLQSFLRDFDALPSEGERKADDQVVLDEVEKLLGRHFGLTVEELHRGLIVHSQRYPPNNPDYEGFAE